MPNSQEFANYYFFNSEPDGSTTYSNPASNSASTLTDGPDGSTDGTTAIGDQLIWSDNGGTTTLYGFTSNGDPIIQISPVDFYVLSDNRGLVGQTVGPTTTGGPFIYCFGAGTQIATPGGEVAAETLKIGDLVCTAEGAQVPVKWLGVQTLRTMFTSASMVPVRIKAGALGGGLPHSDLTVTADHGMILDGMVINASALVNRDTIDWVPLAELGDSLKVYHVETEDHEVILANGAASETFIDHTGRKNFDNYAEYLGLYGAERPIPEMDRPRIASQRILPATVKARLSIDDVVLDAHVA